MGVPEFGFREIDAAEAQQELRVVANLVITAEAVDGASGHRVKPQSGWHAPGVIEIPGFQLNSHATDHGRKLVEMPVDPQGGSAHAAGPVGIEVGKAKP